MSILLKLFAMIRDPNSVALLTCSGGCLKNPHLELRQPFIYTCSTLNKELGFFSSSKIEYICLIYISQIPSRISRLRSRTLRLGAAHDMLVISTGVHPVRSTFVTVGLPEAWSQLDSEVNSTTVHVHTKLLLSWLSHKSRFLGNDCFGFRKIIDITNGNRLERSQSP